MTERKKIPIGIEDFQKLRERNCYFVDKTMMIKDIIDNGAMVTLCTRPRRFGKTLNMSMLRYFFEKSEKDNSYLFDGLEISKMGESYLSHMGQYPVISISLKSMKQATFELSFLQFKNLVIREFQRHDSILKSEKLKPQLKQRFEEFYNGIADDDSYFDALKLLSDCLVDV